MSYARKPVVIVKSYYRKRRTVRKHARKHPKKIGSTWIGDKYIHGPRLRQPNEFKYLVLTKPNKNGVRRVVGPLKRTGKWAAQSTLKPK